MRVSRFLLPTLKEAPAEAELASHRLMLRSGMIKRLAAGIYTWMPLGLRVLRKVEAEVKKEGVEFEAASAVADSPWKGIIEAAESNKCDLIVMASHGRRGLEGLLLGSETMKVLTHSTTPVLVCR